jgi:hypothetical protein
MLRGYHADLAISHGTDQIGSDAAQTQIRNLRSGCVARGFALVAGSLLDSVELALACVGTCALRLKLRDIGQPSLNRAWAEHVARVVPASSLATSRNKRCGTFDQLHEIVTWAALVE